MSPAPKEDLTTAFAVNAVVMQPTDRGAVLISEKTGDCFELNHVGTEIWQLLARGDLPAEIASKLSLKYSVAESSVTSDVDALVAKLIQQGLISARRP